MSSLTRPHTAHSCKAGLKISEQWDSCGSPQNINIAKYLFLWEILRSDFYAHFVKDFKRLFFPQTPQRNYIKEFHLQQLNSLPAWEQDIEKWRREIGMPMFRYSNWSSVSRHEFQCEVWEIQSQNSKYILWIRRHSREPTTSRETIMTQSTI